jgi:hypothetical protein
MDLSSIGVSPFRLDQDWLDRDLLDRDLLDQDWDRDWDREVAADTLPRSGDMTDFSLPRPSQHSSKPDGTKPDGTKPDGTTPDETKPDVVFREAPPREPSKRPIAIPRTGRHHNLSQGCGTRQLDGDASADRDPPSFRPVETAHDTTGVHAVPTRSPIAKHLVAKHLELEHP